MVEHPAQREDRTDNARHVVDHRCLRLPVQAVEHLGNVRVEPQLRVSYPSVRQTLGVHRDGAEVSGERGENCRNVDAGHRWASLQGLPSNDPAARISGKRIGGVFGEDPEYR